MKAQPTLPAGTTSEVWHSPIARLVKVALLIGALLVVPQLSSNPFLLSILIAALMFGTYGAIYDLMIGFCGLTNFGYAGFIAVGSYAAALSTVLVRINPWYGLLIGGVASMLVGMVTCIIASRVKGFYLGLLTWFVGETVRLTIANSTEITRGMLGLTVPPLPALFGIDFARTNLDAYYYTILGLSAAIMGASWMLVRSDTGRAFRAIRDDELAAASLGLRPDKFKLINFALASFFTGVVGAFYAYYVGILSPSPEEFGVSRTIEVLTVTYLGGRGTLWGPMVAGFLVVGFQEALRDIGAWRLVLFGAMLISVMLFFPRGLAALKKHVW